MLESEEIFNKRDTLEAERTVGEVSGDQLRLEVLLLEEFGQHLQESVLTVTQLALHRRANINEALRTQETFFTEFSLEQEKIISTINCDSNKPF